jgi:predicted nucleotidyltransferase
MGFTDDLHQIESESKRKINEIVKEVSDIKSDDWSLVVNGSFARHEVTQGSDFDFFILHKPTANALKIKKAIQRINGAAKKAKVKLPSDRGVFGQKFDGSTLISNIGGDDDGNRSITRRVLYLLEGHAITNQKLFNSHRDQLVNRYIQSNISDHQLGLFLLNDFIRYYRTVCVDFEFKTYESKKPWGIRNIKLIFSRKLMYFSGALMVAETAQRSVKRKRQIIIEHSKLTPIQRVQKICGNSADRALASYATFLKRLDDKDVRKSLEKTTKKNQKDNPIFRDLKDEGQHFSAYLMSALQNTYSSSHPIHRALML